MDAQLKTKWIEALRSGEYEQNRGGLYENDSLCCLGVLWTICGKPNNLNELWDANLAGQTGCLIEMNDRQKKSFSEIADWIEANL